MQMTVDSSTDAACGDSQAWESIDWTKAERVVSRLQARIVKATQESKRRRVHALQFLLTRSFYGKALAVKRVTENQGKRTPGVDGVIWQHPGSKWRAIHDLRRRGYKPLPLRRLYIPKSNGQKRPLGIPTMKDRAMQALHLLALDPVAETVADRNSYGFRKARSCADAIEQCFNALSQRFSARWILEGDIKACFDRINHDWLLTNIPMDKVILRKWLKAGYVEKSVLFPTEEGTPQGGIISPALANMTLDGLEATLRQHVPRFRSQRVNLVRYADDFVTTGTSKEVLETHVMPIVTGFLRGRGLTLSVEKTVLTQIGEGFDFLGQNVRKFGGKLLIRPSKKNVRTFLTNIRKVIKDHRQESAATLIGALNPKIRGWANYHCHACSKATFAYVDHRIHQAVWRWAIRRHRNKPKQWIVGRYFGSQGHRNWVFFGDCDRQDAEQGRPRRLTLCLAAATAVRRHTKIKGACNPYDPIWHEYLLRRPGVNRHSGRSVAHLADAAAIDGSSVAKPRPLTGAFVHA
jgi:RNA-directed DNA polymerase